MDLPFASSVFRKTQLHEQHNIRMPRFPFTLRTHRPWRRRSVSNIFDVTKPFSYILKLFGYACFTVSTNTDDANDAKTNVSATIRVTTLDTLFFAVNGLVCTVLIGLTPYASEPKSDSNTNGLLHIGLSLLYLYHDAVILAALCGGFLWQRDRVAGILCALHRVDCALHDAIGVAVPHRRHHRRLWRLLCGLVLHNVVRISIGTGLMRAYCENAMPWGLALVKCAEQLYWTVTCANLILLYCFGLVAVRQRVELVNETIGTVVAVQQRVHRLSKPQRQQQQRRCVTVATVAALAHEHHATAGMAALLPLETVAAQTEAIRSLRRVHAQLIDLSGECNVCFAWPVAALTAAIFGYLLFQLFSVYKVVSDVRSLSHSIAFIVLNLWWNVYFVVLLLAVVAAGSRLAEAGRQTGLFVHRALNGLRMNADAAVVGELLLFGQQVLHRVPVASCGLFVFDWSLAYSVRGVGVGARERLRCGW